MRVIVLGSALLAVLACADETSTFPASGGSGTGAAAASGSGAGAAGTGASTTGGNGSGAGSVGGSGTGGSGGSGSGLCPAQPPANGSPCQVPPQSGGSNPAAHCSWGDDPRPLCRTLARCTMDDTWEVTALAAACSTTPPLPVDCPATPPADGTVCNDTTTECWYADQNCYCSDCAGGSPYPICQTIDPPEWACRTGSTGCPDDVPQAGASCSQEGLDCGRSCELPIVCTDGAWVYQGFNCPMCAAPTTPIATPSGERPIAELRAGDLVYSEHEGSIVAVPLLSSSKTRVNAHRVMRVTLSSGAVLHISAGHPTADARTFGDLEAGSELDGYLILAVEVVPYEHTHTHDILPDSDTGTYFAAGAQIGTTL